MGSGADRLPIVADAGGSNGYRLRAWKVRLARLATETGLAITVCHYPPGTSKCGTASSSRMFSFITMNWRGRPLTSVKVSDEGPVGTGDRHGTSAGDPAESEPETDHHSGVRVAANGTSLSLAEKSLDDPVSLDLYLKVDAEAGRPGARQSVVGRMSRPVIWPVTKSALLWVPGEPPGA